MNGLLFLTVIVFGAGLAPAVPQTASIGAWCVAALGGEGVPGSTPIPLWIARAALTWIPVGPPAFRLGAGIALLAGAALLLAARLLRSTRPATSVGSVLRDLEEERRWTASETAAVLLWALAGPLWGAARGAWTEMVFLGVALFAWDRGRMFFAHRNTGRQIGAILGLGLSAGIATAIDPRWLLTLPAAMAALGSRSSPQRSPRAQIIAVAGLLTVTLFVWLLIVEWDVLRVSDSIGQAYSSVVERKRLWFRFAFEGGSLMDRLNATFRPLGLPLLVASPFLVSGLWKMGSRDRKQTVFHLLLGGTTLLIPPLLPLKNAAMFGPLGLLALMPFFTQGAVLFLRAWPGPGFAILLTIPLLLLWPLRNRSFTDPECRAGDLLRSAPLNGGIRSHRSDSRAALAYRQIVWGERSDVCIATETVSDPTVDEEMTPSGLPEGGLPFGFLIRRSDSDAGIPADPVASISLGRLPLFLAESGGGLGNEDRPAPEMSAAHRALGDAFNRARVPDQAEEEYLKALAFFPEDREATAALGRLLLDYGDGARASAALDRALRMSPRDPSLLADGARTDLQEGRWRRALERLETAVDITPTDLRIGTELATLYEKMNQPRDAARQWSRLVSQAPTDKSVRWRLTQAWLSAREPGRALEAVDDYLALPLSEEERRDGNAFRELLRTALREGPAVAN